MNRSVEAVHSPAARLALALAAAHAARAGAIRAIQLSDVDLGNRWLTIAGRVRPMDDLTHQMLMAWLDHRCRRWPNTANPHLLINQMTALETGPVSGWWIKHELHGQDATWNGSASTASSKKPSFTVPTHSTSLRSSVWTRRPRSATQTRHGSFSRPASSAPALRVRVCAHDS
ncbi:hypothetical protein [Streptomyces roseochromogenus]|uniref:hypothetical protein n=1 Tax=Streptomyces roseochromogenus TaxID=285450 RepID=UPI00131A3EA1|nr:hypothetical protein [Streptomyces roseochromogenus]